MDSIDCEELINPGCLQYISKQGADHYCANADCIAQRYQRVKHYVKVMDIEGLGDKTIAKLMAGKRKVEVK